MRRALRAAAGGIAAAAVVCGCRAADEGPVAPRSPAPPRGSLADVVVRATASATELRAGDTLRVAVAASNRLGEPLAVRSSDSCVLSVVAEAADGAWVPLGRACTDAETPVRFGPGGRVEHVFAVPGPELSRPLPPGDYRVFGTFGGGLGPVRSPAVPVTVLPPAT